MKCKLFAAAGIAALMMAATPASAVVISQMDGTHDVVNGASGTDPGTAGLGHTVTLHTDNAGGWAAALGGGAPVIIVEQDGADSASSAAVNAWVSGGGRLIMLGGGGAESGMILLNSMFGTAMVPAFSGPSGTFAKTAAAAGTTFADDAMTLLGLSSHHEILSGALPAASTVFYSGGGFPIAFRTTLGAGDVIYLGYDYCCGGTQPQRDDWYGVLDSAITFNAVPEPGTLALFGLGLAGLGVARRKRMI